MYFVVGHQHFIQLGQYCFFLSGESVHILISAFAWSLVTYANAAPTVACYRTCIPILVFFLTIFHFVLGCEQGVLENGNKVSDHRLTHPRKFPQQNKVGHTRLVLSQVLSRCVPILYYKHKAVKLIRNKIFQNSDMSLLLMKIIQLNKKLFMN